MKKKLALICMTGIIILGISACGNKNTDNNTSESEVSESSTETEAETEKVSDREDYIGLKDLNIDEYVKLADYKNMQVSVKKPEVTDEIIKKYVNQTLLVGNITGRAVAEGDVANIDFEGKLNGEAFDGGTANGYELEIGSGAFIEGFETGLIGVMPGETIDLNLTFPENYGNGTSELAGKAVVFTVTVNSIKGSADYDTVTPEEMEKMGIEYASKEEVWDEGKKAVEESAAQTFDTNVKSAIAEKMVEESTISSVPEYLVEEEMQNYKNYMDSMTRIRYGVDLETFVTAVSGMTMEEYESEIKEMCELTVKQNMILEAVARAEGIEVTEEKVKEEAGKEQAVYNYESVEAFLDEVGYDTYRTYLINDNAMGRLVEIVRVEETDAE